MTIIRPNSISGINSITAKNTDQMKLYDSNGSWSHVRAGVITATTVVSNLTGNVTGNISGGTVAGSTGTFSSDVTISGDLGVGGTITYEDVARVDAVGLSTYREGLHVGPLAGIALTAYKDGSIRTSGIITANTYYGSGANLTGIDATQIVTGNTSVQTVDTGSDGHVKITTEGSERLRIASDGKIGVAQDSPAATLHIGGGNITSPEVRIQRTASYDNAWKFYQSHYGSSDHGTLFIQPTLATKPNLEIINSAGNMGMRVDPDTGVISVPSGGGIDFGATANGTGSQGADGEILSDYETGSWTGTIVTGGGTVSNAWYTKVGKTVWVTCHLSAWGNTTSGNSIQVSGLPFTESGGNTGHGATVWSKHAQSGQAISCWVAGTTLKFLHSSTGSGSWNYMLHSGLVASSASCYCSTFYRTA
tara:strand:+ start:3176 stop:4435 length:1260 start_codon:yes stop_codon:yes gene_type:complete